MKNILRFLIFAFVLGCIFGGANYAFAANTTFTADTELVLTGSPPATVYIASSSAADSVNVLGAIVNSNVPAGSTFTLKTTTQTKLSITPSVGSVNMEFSTAYFSTGYVVQWTASSTTANAAADFSVGVPLGSTYYRINVNGVFLNYYLSNSAGIISFTYSGGFSDKVFTVSQESPPSYGGTTICNAPVAPAGGFGVVINNNDSETTSTNVVLTLKFGSDTSSMRISNYSDLIVLPLQPATAAKNWILTEGQGLKTVYAQFYSSCGLSSAIVSDTINLVSAITATTTPAATTTPTVETATTTAPTPTVTAPITTPTPEIIEKPVFQVPAPVALIKQITKRLIKGMTDEQIKSLQEFLAQDSEVYPEKLITGYYGLLTEKAVQRFQKKYGIAKEGDEGFGTVGPKTRAKLNELLGKVEKPAAPVLPEQAAERAKLIQQIREQIQTLQQKLIQLMSELVLKLKEQQKI